MSKNDIILKTIQTPSMRDFDRMIAKARSARDSMARSQRSKRLRIAFFNAPQLYWAMWVWS